MRANSKKRVSNKDSELDSQKLLKMVPSIYPQSSSFRLGLLKRVMQKMMKNMFQESNIGKIKTKTLQRLNHSKIFQTSLSKLSF